MSPFAHPSKESTDMALVLIIDDSTFARNQIGKILKAAGHSVIEADNGLTGLAALKRQKPDCILTDMLMPVMDGLKFLRALREEKVEVPAIVLTADVQLTTRDESLALGAFDVLNKPPRTETLLGAVEKALASRE